MKLNKISIIGLGYIGLPTAAIFASKKIKVIGVDVNEKIVNTINQGKIHIVENDLDTLVSKVVKQGYLKATTKPESADVFFITVPTPFKDKNFKPDLSFIKSACKSIASILKVGNLVILESTSPVGTTEKISEWLSKARPDLTFPHTHGKKSDIRLAYCPERVLPGKILYELVHNDRIIGGMTSKCSDTTSKIYKLFVKGELIYTDPRTAEMSKLTENSFRDVNIAFANELSIICDKLNINVWDLIKIANLHPRVNILQPGPGVGGHCIAIDPWFIIDKSSANARLIRLARQINDQKTAWVVNKVKSEVANYLKENPTKKLKDVTIACYGITYKPNIDDLRESPALKITQKIAKKHAGKVIVFEPNIKVLPEMLKKNKNLYLKSFNKKNSSTNIAVLLVDHREFKNINISASKKIDTRGIWQSNVLNKYC